MTGTALLLDDIYLHHETAAGHPECPERLEVISQALQPLLKSDRLRRIFSRRAAIADVLLCHDSEYVDDVLTKIRAGETQLFGVDVSVSKESGEVALLAVGGVIDAVTGVLKGESANAFCVVRPPGHHARPAQAMGFCLFNNVAIAARHAQRKFGIDRVAIVDWDVHHGNGTQDIFYRDGSVLFFSTHQSPWYPGTGSASERGEGKGDGLILNRPFPAGSGREQILGAFREDLIPALDRFKPELILISAGFDSRIGDPLGQFRLSDSDFSEMTARLMDAADKHADGRLVSILEGGYNLKTLGSAVEAHVRTLSGANGNA